MQFRISKVLLCSVVLLVLGGLVACTPSSPEEKVAATRTQYMVTLNAFFPQEPPVEETMPELLDAGDEEEGASIDLVAMEPVDGDTEGVDGDADSMAVDENVVDSGPKTVGILLDLVVRFDGTDPLDGLTLDISQADPFEKEKATFRHYIELGSMVKSETKQVSFVLEDVDYVDGDLFSVNLREVVAPGDRAEYREFAAAQ